MSFWRDSLNVCLTCVVVVAFVIVLSRYFLGYDDADYTNVNQVREEG